MTTIKNIIKKTIDELSTSNKETFKRGVEHIIYPSKKHSNRLFKVGLFKSVDTWVKIFKSNPNIFPKIYRVGKINHPNVNTHYVEIEKLDTDKAESEWDELEEKLELCSIIDSIDGKYGSDLSQLYFNYIDNKKVIIEISSKLKECDKDGYELFIKWIELFKQCQKHKENITGHKSRIDAHKYNFGYGLDGKLKCLDI
jgi:hypothetical protein